jgi:hypothetical protein
MVLGSQAVLSAEWNYMSWHIGEGTCRQRAVDGISTM